MGVFVSESRLTAERSAERGHANKDHQVELQLLRKEQRKEMDALMRRFANHASDLDKLRVASSRLKVGYSQASSCDKLRDASSYLRVGCNHASNLSKLRDASYLKVGCNHTSELDNLRNTSKVFLPNS